MYLKFLTQYSGMLVNKSANLGVHCQYIGQYGNNCIAVTILEHSVIVWYI